MIRLNDLYRFFYQKWNKQNTSPQDGYSIILLTPGDLPFFTKIALEVCQGQDSKHLVETIVVPDSQIKAGFSDLLSAWSKDYTVSPVRMVKFRPLEILINRYHRNPFNNCWHQLLQGVEAMNTNYGLLHDVDLFLLESNFLRQHYEAFIKRQVVCLGVSPVWDDWYAKQNLDHLVATWELMFDRHWVQSFKPWEHRAHHGVVCGKEHTFDMMLWPQCQTPPNKIQRHQKEWGFIHFNHVVSTYRRFQQSQGSFEDEYFRILLIRLLIDAYDQSGWQYDVPSLEQLVQGLSEQSNRVTYQLRTTWEHYPEFRKKLQELLDSGALNSDEKMAIIMAAIQPFDRYFSEHFALIMDTLLR